MRYDLEMLKHQRPSSNPMMQARLCSEYINQCNKLFESFPGRATKGTADRWSKLLLDGDFTLHEVSTAVQRTVVTCERLPSYAEFTTILRNSSPRPDPQEEVDARTAREAAALREKTRLMLEAYLEKYDQDRLESQVREWWYGVYGGNPADYGFPLRVFLPIFFQDLRTAKGDMERCIEIGRERSRQAI